MNNKSESDNTAGMVDQQQLVRSGCVTESIFDGTSIVPLADVQHIEKRGDGSIMVIMKSTTYAFEQDEWMNPVYFAKGEAQRFLSAWRRYRSELESSSLDEVLAGNALFFLLELRPLYDFVNASDAPRNVKDCLGKINLAAASIKGALGDDGYARAKARDEKMKADLEKFLSQNVKSESTDAPQSGGANTDESPTGHTLDSTACSPLLFLNGVYYTAKSGMDYKTNSHPIDFDSVRRSQHTFGVWERGSVHFVIVACDPDNPDCVVEILSPVELRAEDENSMPFRDSRGYLGYIVDGYLVCGEQIASSEFWKSARVECAKNLKPVGVSHAQIPVVGENIVGENVKSQLAQVGRENIESATIGGELRGHCLSLANNQVLASEERGL